MRKNLNAVLKTAEGIKEIAYEKLKVEAENIKKTIEILIFEINELKEENQYLEKLLKDKKKYEL